MNIRARNQYGALAQVVTAFDTPEIQAEKSRNGDTLRLPGLTTITLTNPHERVLMMDARDANPFFHLMEAMAMLGSRNSVSFLSFFAKQMESFSDDGIRYNAFYGERARVTHGDQLARVIQELQARPNSRQAVVDLWSPTDLGRETRDKACNMMMVFEARNGVLDMTTINRSNDAVWGYFGANSVHFPFFHEYVSDKLELSMGQWQHVSVNFHVYGWQKKWGPMVGSLAEDRLVDPYSTRQLRCLGLGASMPQFDRELDQLLDIMAGITAMGPESFAPVHLQSVQVPTTVPFLKTVVWPMFCCYYTWKSCRAIGIDSRDSYDRALHFLRLKGVPNIDWITAATFWLNTRLSPETV